MAGDPVGLTGQIENLRLNALTADCLDQLTVQLIAFVVLLTQRAPAAVMAFVFGGLGPLNLSGEVINKAFER